MKAEVLLLPRQSTVEGQSFFDITDLERYMIEAHGARFSCFNHGTLHKFPKDLDRRKLFKPLGELIQHPDDARMAKVLTEDEARRIATPSPSCRRRSPTRLSRASLSQGRG